MSGRPVQRSFFPTMMLNDHYVSLRWSGSILALGIFVGGISGLGFGWAVTVTNKGNPILVGLCVLMAASFTAMTLTGSIPILIVLTFLNGIAWGFWPILYSVPFHLPGIRPRELAMGIAFIMMMSSIGTTLGPLLTGLLQEATGDLRLSLLLVSIGPLSVSGAGMFLKATSPPKRESVTAVAAQTSDN